MMRIKRIKRWFRHFYQRQTRGFDDSELWNLYTTITDFILPRLIAFRKMEKSGVPSVFIDNHDEYLYLEEGEIKYNEALDKMILAFQNIKDGKDYKISHCVQIDNGLLLFAKYFLNLWD